MSFLGYKKMESAASAVISLTSFSLLVKFIHLKKEVILGRVVPLAHGARPVLGLTSLE